MSERITTKELRAALAKGDEINAIQAEAASEQKAVPEIPKTQTEIDVSNLNFYAGLFRKHEWQTEVIHWGVFEHTLYKIAERIAALTAELADERLAFEHANQLVGKYMADAERLTAEVTRLREQVTEQDKDFEFVVENNTKVKIENDRLREQVEALSWKPITSENLPQLGDELYSPISKMVMRLPEGFAPVIPVMEDFTFAGWTHFRPITPPASEKEPQHG